MGRRVFVGRGRGDGVRFQTLTLRSILLSFPSPPLPTSPHTNFQHEHGLFRGEVEFRGTALHHLQTAFQQEHGSVTSRPFRKLWQADKPTNQPTHRRKDRVIGKLPPRNYNFSVEVSLPMTLFKNDILITCFLIQIHD